MRLLKGICIKYWYIDYLGPTENCEVKNKINIENIPFYNNFHEIKIYFYLNIFSDILLYSVTIMLFVYMYLPFLKGS